MKHLSLLTVLMFSSSMVYAGWITKGFEYKGDCLEMMCDCVEDSETRDGYCCPNGTSFNGKGDAHIEYTPCKCLEANTYYNTTTQKCLAKPICNLCQKLDVAIGTCVTDTAKNNKQVQDACHVCRNGQIELKNENDVLVCDQQCCSSNQYCTDGQCVDCIVLSQDIQKCCDPKQLVTQTKNVLFSGDYIYGNKKVKLGCCSQGEEPLNMGIKNYEGLSVGDICCSSERIYTDKGKQKCCAENQQSVENACCSVDLVYEEKGIEKCCKGIVKNVDGVKKCFPTCASLGKADGLRYWGTWGDKCNRGPSIGYSSSEASVLQLGSTHSSKKSCASRYDGYLYYFSDKSFKDVQVGKYLYANRGSGTVAGKNIFVSQDYDFKADQFYTVSITDGKAHHRASWIEMDFTKIQPDLMCH